MAAAQVANGVTRPGFKIKGGEFGIRFDNIDQVMTYFLPQVHVRLGGADVKIFVHLHGIGTDDLRIKV